MSYFTWSPAFSIGLKKIDQQHKSLVQAVNALHEALHAENGAEDLGWILNFLANYTAEHFQTEEALMDAFAFPDQEEHIRIHKELLGQVGAFIGRYQSGKEDISQELLDFLKQWLVVHIGQEDRRLGAHVQRQGLNAGKNDTPGPEASPTPNRIPPIIRPGFAFS
jgi:hemerythrin